MIFIVIEMDKKKWCNEIKIPISMIRILIRNWNEHHQTHQRCLRKVNQHLDYVQIMHKAEKVKMTCMQLQRK